ncbi:adenylyl-sulfate kinase [Chloroflexota bacterium]
MIYMKPKDAGSAGWVIWFVGLPGAGKSTYAQAVSQALNDRGYNVRYLSMDQRRQAYLTTPQYTPEERDKAYRLFAEEAAQIANQGINVIVDGTAPKLSMRQFLRRMVPRFVEIYVHCPLETAMNRESNRPEGSVMGDLYKKAIERKQTGKHFEGLGEVVGVDTPFEENPNAECVIESDQMNFDGGLDRILKFLVSFL